MSFDPEQSLIQPLLSLTPYQSTFFEPYSLLLFGELFHNTTPSFMIIQSFRFLYSSLTLSSPYSRLSSNLIIWRAISSNKGLLLDSVVSLLPSPYYLESY